MLTHPERSHTEHKYNTTQSGEAVDSQRLRMQSAFQRSHQAQSLNQMLQQLDYSNTSSSIALKPLLQQQLIRHQSSSNSVVRGTEATVQLKPQVSRGDRSQGSQRGIANIQHHNQASGNLQILTQSQASLTGIRKIDRVSNQQISHHHHKHQSSMHRSSNNFKSIDYTHTLQQQPIVALQMRERSESVQQVLITSKDRNCKTTSPTGQFISQTMVSESRMRKKSKEYKKKEGFADLIVILGIKYNEFIEKRRVIPQVVSGYPDLNNKDIAKEHNYVDNLIWICFPEGYTVQGYEKRKEGELCQMKTFHFIITNQDGHKKYITSILFKELFLSGKLGAFIVPKSICLISSKPIFSLQKQLLSLIFQKVILPYNSASIQAHAQHPTNYLAYLKEYHADMIHKNPDSFLMQRIEFYLTIFFNHLYYCEEVDKDIEIEQIRERSTPMGYDAQGQIVKKKQKNKRKITESYFRFRNTKTYGFTLENYSFELLLQCLKPERILFLITALLLERKIILIKENFGDIALIMESLVSLLNPLAWNFVFITYLTPKLVECLEAPFPYIIGVSRKVWDDHCVMREFPDDIIIYDIDNQELLNQVREELPPLPQPQASVLQRSLKGLLDIKERFVETIQENATKRIPKDKIDEFYWAYAQLRVKQSFFNFFLLTINNYIGYFKNLDEEGDLSPNKKDKQMYDKLSSQDVFDFDNYLNQFEGTNKDFMDKFVKTQSFNNFIEETYKNTTSQTPIGFFKTNFEVMLDHSFKKLKKEQNKLLDKTFFNLQNPVKFNIGHMFKEYKKKLLMKNHSKVKDLLKSNDFAGNQDNDPHIDFFNRSDVMGTLLTEDLQSSTDVQLSILNKLNFDLITEMPGIQYEQIGAYEQRKTYRSEHSQDRMYQNRTAISGNNSQFFDINTKTMNSREKLNESDKSRNYGKIVQSRSGELKVMQSQTLKNLHKRGVGGGNIYKDYLAMADSKNVLLQSQEFDNTNGSIIRAHNHTQFYGNQKTIKNHNSSISNTNKINEKINSKYRVHSENSNKLGSFPLNKTVIVSSNQHLQKTSAMPQQQSKLKQHTKTSTTRNDQLNQSQQVKKNMNITMSLIKLQQSPQNIAQANHLSSQSQLTHNSNASKQQSVLKEALYRKIMHERNKHGLQLQSSDARSVKRLHNQKSSMSNILSPHNQSLSNINSEEQVKHPHKNPSTKYVPNSNIDLMNPKKQKISRNEERKLAKKKGFLDPQQHESFYQFIYSPNEELSKLAMMQLIQKRMQTKHLDGTKLQDQQSFSNLLYQNYNSNASDEDILTKVFQNSNANQIQFQMRMHNETVILQGNDPLSTTINFQSNFVQQKPQVNQSPSMTNTEMSSVKKKGRAVEFSHEVEDFVMVENSSPDVKPLLGLDSAMSSAQFRSDGFAHGWEKRKQNQENSKGREKSIGNLLQGLRAYQTNYDSQHQSKINEESETIEVPPLSLGKVEQQLNKTQAIKKTTRFTDLESPKVFNQEKSGNVSFKQLMTNLKSKASPQNASNQNNVTVRKHLVSSNQGNKSPKNAVVKDFRTTKNDTKTKQIQYLQPMTSTFDNTTRTDKSKSQVNVMMRKRSEPSIIEKSPGTTNNALTNNKQMFKNHASIPTLESNNNLKSQQSFTYYKQRPLNPNSKTNKSYHIPTATLQINLEKKEKLAPTRELNMPSLRVSPLPDLNQAINAQSSQQFQNHSSSALSEDQVVIQTQENNRGSGPLTNNYYSRLSNQSINHNSNEVLFASMSHIIDQDMFDKANLTIATGAQTARHDSQNKHIHKHQKHSMKNSLKKQLVGHSQRTASNLQSEYKSRGSQASQKYHQRTSQISMFADNKASQERQMFSNNSRHSDLLSQNELSNNIMVQRSSPKLTGKAQNKIAIQTQQQSVTSSYETQSMKNILSTLKQNIPQTAQNQAGVNIVHIDLDKRNRQQITPKGAQVQTSKGNKTLNHYHKHQRNSSIEEVKAQINMSNEQRKHNDTAQTSKYFSQTTSIQKKQAHSPQPVGNLSASNAYLKSLQSQEFQLKEKGKKQKQNVLSSNFQSSDPLVPLLKDSHKSGRKSKPSESKQVMAKRTTSSNKNLKLDIQESSIREIKSNYLTNSMLRTNSKPEMPPVFSKSTKNLFSTGSKDQLLEEIKGVNDTLVKIEELKRNASKSGYNILEETLTRRTNSSASYQTSPKNFNNSGSQQIRGFKSSQIFKSITQANKQANGDESNSNQIATVRTKMYPQMNFQIQSSMQEGSGKHHMFHKQHSQQEPFVQRFEDHGSDQATIELPRQLHNSKPYTQMSSFHHELKKHQSQIIRDDHILVDIDHMMMNEERPPMIQRDSQISDQVLIGDVGENLSGGGSAPNHQSAFRTLDSQYMQTKTMTNNMSQQSDDASQPLIEIRYNQNMTDQANLNQRVNGSSSMEDIKEKSRIPTSSGGNSKTSKQLLTENSMTQNVISSRHSHTVSIDKLPHELGKVVQKQNYKKRHLRHGLTTCFAQPAKDSVQYVRRDLNQDVFCKINSHIGDIDNDPHTPKSDQSYRSIEKNRKKIQRHFVLQETIGITGSFQEQLGLVYPNSQQQDFKSAMHGSKHRNPRFQNNSGDLGSEEKVHGFIGDGVQHKRNKWEEVEESKKQPMESASQALQALQNGIAKDMCKPINPSLVQNEVYFDDADLKDTDDKFTSRDFNFNRLKNMTSTYNDDYTF